ncbi:hypothetical protein SADUNF_Sadunf17G0044600 [Salix dunnii]|uniref:BHLH domain-containing protein n=1 Tax=Salix dunnii TaxID=1413687 RepID=A0A835J5D1_9ROSI|nr:hypothetical protein SADUNF_Sadunf17G0044600 [Salix dunnii]
MSKQEGVASLWRGSSLTVNRAMIVTASQLASYDQAKEMILEKGLVSDGIGTHVAASFVASVASNPIDVIKTTVMNMKVEPGVEPPYKGALDCAVKTVKAEGPMALYKGFIPTTSRQGPFTAVLFVTLEQAEKSWLFPPHSTWKLPNFHCMTTSLDHAQLQCSPECMNPGTCMTSANMTMPGLAVSSIPNLKTQQGNEAYGLPRCLPSNFQNFLLATNPYDRENLSVFSYGYGREGVQNPIPGCQRRFLVFDQSGNEQRLIYSSFGPPVSKPTAADAKPIPGYYDHNEYAAKMDQTKLKLPEVSDENHFHSEEKQAEKIIEEVTSSDGPNKRQKLIDGEYKKSCLVDTASSVKVERFHGNDHDMEPNYAKRQSQEGEMISILSSKQFRKDKIRATLKILESIIPGAKDKEPLLVLDEAIDYLKSLKHKAKALEVNYL